MSHWGTVADWVVAVGTLIVAAVAVFQETIRAWVYRPKFGVSIRTEPPDCVAVPLTKPDGNWVADAIYLRLWIENIGNATAKNAEVYAQELRRERADHTWERIGAFPPMNLKWSNMGYIYFPSIAPGMGKHCDLGHIVDPARSALVGEDNLRLEPANQVASLAFDLIVAPNHRGHIVGPGEYRLDVVISAENARPIKRTIAISLRGVWHKDETRMLRDGVGVGMA